MYILYTFLFLFFFFCNDTATTEIYTLSLHDALPISFAATAPRTAFWTAGIAMETPAPARDRKSTRLNSSHGSISYAVFCLIKKKSKKVFSVPGKHIISHNMCGTISNYE